MAWRGVVAGVLIGLAACRGAAPPAGGEVLRIGVASAPVTLDPRFATDATSERINRLLYARLVDFDAHGRPRPALAQWRALTPTRYRITLRPGRAPFHDGRPVRAADVAATYRAVLDPATGSPHRSALRHVRAIEVIDDENLEFTIDRPDPLFPAYLVLGIVPAEVAAAGRARVDTPIGSGPFRFVAWPEPGRVQLRRIRDGQVIEFVRVPDPTVRVLKLLRGEIDLLQNDLPPELVRYLERREGVRVVHAPGTNFTYLGFHCTDPVTGRVEVRRAIAHAIDRAAIVEHLFHGHARTAHAILVPEHWAGAPALAGFAFDPAQARAWLRAAGYAEGDGPRLRYETSADPFRLRVATVIQQQLGAVGIDVTIESFDWGTFYGDIVAGRFQMYSLSWVGIHTPDIFRYVFHSESTPPGGANRGRCRDAQVDALIERAEAQADPERRIPLYRRLQQRLLETLPYVPLWYEDHFYAARAGVEGYALTPEGHYDGLIDIRRARP